MPAIRPVPYVLFFWVLMSGGAFAADAPAAQSLDTQAPATADAPVAGLDADAGIGRLLPVPAGTTLAFEMVDSLSSKTSQRGDRFSLRLVEPLMLDGQLLIPAGTLAVGEVVHADRARGSGQAGELILAARTIQVGDTTVALRSFSPAASGAGLDRTGTASKLSLVFTPAAFMIRGGEKELPAGSLVTAKTRAPVELRPLTDVSPDAIPPGPSSIAEGSEPSTDDNSQRKPNE